MLDCSKPRVEKAEVYSFCGDRGRESHFCITISGYPSVYLEKEENPYDMEELLDSTVLEHEVKIYHIT